MNNSKTEEVARRLKGIQTGDEIVAEGRLSDIKDDEGFYNMPCPGSAPGGMSIFGKDENYSYVEAFCQGHEVEFFTAVEDKIVIRYGGKIELKYRVTEDALKEYGLTLRGYRKFVENLRGLGLTVRVIPGGD